MNDRRERRSNALAKLEEENKKKETQLKVLVKLSKELEQERTQLYIQLQNEVCVPEGKLPVTVSSMELTASNGSPGNYKPSTLH
jgi:hypothetical protein